MIKTLTLIVVLLFCSIMTQAQYQMYTMYTWPQQQEMIGNEQSVQFLMTPSDFCGQVVFDRIVLPLKYVDSERRVIFMYAFGGSDYEFLGDYPYDPENLYRDGLVTLLAEFETEQSKRMYIFEASIDMKTYHEMYSR